jgi:nucleotide-binding universal stress UspA family protein
MSKRIVVPLDQSTVSESALSLARGLAVRHGIPVTLITVLDAPSSLPDPEREGAPEPSVEPWDDQRAMRVTLPTAPGAVPASFADSDVDEIAENAAQAEAYLQGIAESFPNVSVESRVLYGEPSEQIIDVAQRRSRQYQPHMEDNDIAVVMASHGRSGLGQVLLGSVAWQVIQASGFPVFLVRSSENAQDRSGYSDIERVVIALDGSRFAEQVLPAVDHWVAKGAEAVHLLQVVPSTRTDNAQDENEHHSVSRSHRSDAEQYLSTLSDRLSTQGYTTSWEVSEGDVVATINEAADTFDADLVSLATHGRTGLSRLKMGSVAEHMAQQSSRPLLIVHPGDTE